MAVALSEQGVYSWEEFRTGLLYEIAAAESRRAELPYYHAWLAAFERVTAARGVIDLLDLEEVAFQFEFGERADAP